jgi:hypothetical protein
VKPRHREAPGEEHLQRVRRMSLALPEAAEKLSHGEPTYFVRKKVFVMFANNHHDDGHVAVWIPVPPGLQPEMIARDPRKFYKPPYVGVRGWIGVELSEVDDGELALLILQAWQMIAPKGLQRTSKD